MDFNTYQKKAIESVAIREKSLAALAHRALGLTGEAGELANLVKKIVRDKNGNASDADIAKIVEKLGDTLYYAAALADYYELDLEEVAAKNLAKSQKFKEQRS